MRLVTILFLAVTYLTGTGIQPLFGELADRDKKGLAVANELFELMRLEEATEEMLVHRVDMQIKNEPTVAPYRQIFLDFFSKYLGWESMKSDIANIYTETFSVEELEDLIVFYKTSTGQKLIQVTPQLNAKISELSNKVVQEHIGELQEQIAQELDKIE